MISVIVPVYNASAYLRECVDSIRSQSFGDWELLLVDDGSTDGSGEICDAYAAADKRIRTVHTPNRGVSHARNVGIAEARGVTIAFVDADDAIHPAYLQTLHHTMVATGASVVACDTIEGTSVSWPSSSNLASKVYKTTTYTPRQAIIDTLYQRHLNCSCWGKLYRTEVLRKANGFVEGLRFEDLEAFHRFYNAADGPVVHVHAPLYFYRKNPQGFINTIGADRFDVLTVTEGIEKAYADDPETLRAAHDRRFSANYNIMLLSMRNDLEPQAHQCWELVKARRGDEITNRRVRVRNRLGALVAFCGYKFIKMTFGRGKNGH